MADVDVEGPDWPEGAIVTNVQPGDPLVTVTGYIATTPVGVRQVLPGPQRPGDHDRRRDLRGGGLFDNGTHRNYVKAQAVCREGTQLFGVVAPMWTPRACRSRRGRPPPSEG